ncbi:MAG TPA: sensor histidine kinase [Actinotalea sp.]
MRWWERVGAWDDTHRASVDAVAATALAVLVVPAATSVMGAAARVDTAVWSVALVLPLVWRRSRPAASAAAVYGIALLHLLLGEQLIAPADLVVLVALYSVTVHGPVWAYRTAMLSSLAGAGALGASLLVRQGPGNVESAVIGAAAVALLSLSVFALALVRRARRETIDSLVDRARRLEVERDQLGQIATAAERTRIAREMHDIVAHSLSVIIAQADGGRYAAEQDAGAATRSLTTIAETGRAALTDMRRLLGVLRPESAAAAAPGAGATDGRAGGPSVPRTPGAVADLAPQPAVADIEELVERVRQSGSHISLVRMGSPRRLPPGTGLTVYRICQECLTNVLKHAGPAATTTVLLQWRPASLVLEVSDDGRGAAAESDGGGQGVVGMRERAAMLGGTLVVGPRPGGGYRVRAEIPLPRTDGES